jgi:hypothetical protein
MAFDAGEWLRLTPEPHFHLPRALPEWYSQWKEPPPEKKTPVLSPGGPSSCCCFSQKQSPGGPSSGYNSGNPYAGTPASWDVEALSPQQLTSWIGSLLCHRLFSPRAPLAIGCPAQNHPSSKVASPAACPIGGRGWSHCLRLLRRHGRLALEAPYGRDYRCQQINTTGLMTTGREGEKKKEEAPSFSSQALWWW